ncbi:hypothetical protein [Nocardioides sp. B-3]|uniref:hypothetical protein n=1 Tax=Nocardioides sp. B-3 TaxID=2895565 RepID=UPI00215344D2|nr:hypothetical protein [Nocardioides sp. B-3]UUZ61345.1 hypothetical protein LP418_12645 [Nocardioides sp. B-3]
MRLSVRTAIAAVLLAATACSADEKPAPAPTPTAEDTTDLDWQPTGHSVDERVVVGELWTAIATETDVRFESATGADDVAGPTDEGGTVNAVLLEGDTAVVSFAFGGETTTGVGHRIDLATGERAEIVTPEPANGGDWAMVDDSLYYPALDADQHACSATLAVTDGNGEEGWCPPERVGIAELEANEHGVAAMLFDYDSDIWCRTLTLLGPGRRAAAGRRAGGVRGLGHRRDQHRHRLVGGPPPQAPAGGRLPRAGRRQRAGAGQGHDRHPHLLRRRHLLRQRPDQGKRSGAADALGRLDPEHRLRVDVAGQRLHRQARVRRQHHHHLVVRRGRRRAGLG